MRSRLLLLAPVLGLLLLSGCGPVPADLLGGADPAGRTAPAPRPAPAASASSPAASGGASLLATLRGPTGLAPMAGAATRSTLGPRTDEGSPRTLLVTHDEGEWLRVALPGRPNGRHAWVRAADVDLTATDWRLEVSLSQHRLRVFRGLMQVAEHPVGVGKAVTPTPRGTWFVTDLLRPRDPSGPYGPYAFGLSAYSEVLTSFAGGKGQIGLHGTDTPAGLGKDVSSGCLRLDNEVVRSLAQQLPLGTPVVVRD